MSDVLKGVLGGVVLGAFAFFTGGAGLGLLGTTTLLGSVGVGAALGGALALFPKPKLPDLPSDFGRELQLSGDPLAPRKICYGEAWTAGVLRYYNTAGDNNEDLYLVIVVAGHEIDSVQTVEVDGSTVSLDGSGNVTSPSKWSGMQFRFHLGTDSQTADSTLVRLFSADPVAPWTTDDDLAGAAYAIVKLTFDEEDLNTIPQMRFKVRGRKVYDPRLDSTNGGSGSHRLATPSTWAWSRNAALCAADFMRGVKVNSRAIAGMRVADTRIDWANVIAEANVCDEDVTLDAGGTQDRYTVDGFIDPRQSHGQNLRHFELALAGDITFADGKWRIFAGAYRTPTLHLQDKHFIGPLQHTVHKGESQRYDTAQGSFASASDSGDVLDYPPVSLSSATTGEERVLPLNFALVSNSARAQRCAKLLLEREAAGKRITCTTNLYGYRAVPGETINVSHAAFGLSTQAMRVLDVELSFVQADEGKMGVVTNLVLEAGPSSLYTWDAEETELAAVPEIPKAQVPFPTFTSSFVGSIYRRSSSAPATPTGGSYNFGTKTLTAPTNWSATPPASDGNPLYVSVATFAIQGGTGTDDTAVWTTPAILVSDGVDGDDGADGTSSFVAQIYRRATSQPSTPTGGSYNFTTGVLTPPSGWSTTPPASDGRPLWVSTGLFEVVGTTGTDETVTWTAPSLLVSDGLGNVVIDTRDWTIPDTDPMGKWDMQSGSLANTTMRNNFDGPFGGRPMIMQIAGDGVGTSWYSLWRYYHRYDSSKSYIYYVFVRRHGTVATNGLYLGFTEGEGDVLLRAEDGAANANPYFVSNRGAELANGTWYLAVGIIHPSGYTGGDSGIAGLYDMSGNRIYDGNEFYWNGQEQAENFLRFGFYGGSGPHASNNGFHFTGAVAYEVDGSEPSIRAMLRLITKTGYLTNEAHVVSASADGSGYSLSGAGGTFKVFDGLNDVTTSAAFSVVGSATKNGLTISIGASTGVYSLSGASWTSDAETFTLRAVYGGVTIDKEYSISKSKQGPSADGFVLLPIAVQDDQSGTLPQSGGIVFKTDGRIMAYNNGSETQIGKWWSNAPEAGVGNSYQVMNESQLSGAWDSAAGAVGVWVTMSSDATYRVERTAMEGAGTDTANSNFQVRAVGSTTIEGETIGGGSAGS